MVNLANAALKAAQGIKAPNKAWWISFAVIGALLGLMISKMLWAGMKGPKACGTVDGKWMVQALQEDETPAPGMHLCSRKEASSSNSQSTLLAAAMPLVCAAALAGVGWKIGFSLANPKMAGAAFLADQIF